MSHRRPTSSRFARRSAFTLLEMTLSLVIVSVILLAAQSAVLVAARAVPTERSAVELTANAADVIDQLTSDLRYARSFSTMTTRVVEFTVPDRTGDGQPETIRYQWSGTSGDSLIRRFNGGDPVIIAPAVHRFNLQYDKKATTHSTGVAEGPEIIISSLDTSNSLNDQTVTSSKWRAQHFNPSLPADAISWRVTRVFVKVRASGSTQGETKVQIRPAINGRPSTVVLGETILYENTLSSNFAWKEIPIAQKADLSPSITACLVLQWQKDSESCEVQYRNSFLFGEPVYCMLTGTDGDWNTSNDMMLHYVIGRVTTPSPAETVYNLTAVRCVVQLAASSSAPLITSIRTLEQPEVPGP